MIYFIGKQTMKITSQRILYTQKDWHVYDHFLQDNVYMTLRQVISNINKFSSLKWQMKYFKRLKLELSLCALNYGFD